jgi:hypothetical protein
MLTLQLKGGLSKSLKQVSDQSLPLCWKGQKAFKSVFDVKKEFKSLFLNFASGKNAVMEIPPENYLIVTVNTCTQMTPSRESHFLYMQINDCYHIFT